ncbi:predicted protein [Lodderomyces elongisporus NRRL YB-4239]|uniref:Uncharacterized protein n=1 Tax=Lodderomyces elongisporus (strain ATCC 11503 / CBS 2605 / JCM 1781 / NBRC 1676 / NRRL YB-4239) TaxID=379508 RepID=A5E2B0_LODEL|nr:predicted protein [Lodderomyces elongisporus NRRL YB-4239]
MRKIFFFYFYFFIFYFIFIFIFNFFLSCRFFFSFNFAGAATDWADEGGGERKKETKNKREKHNSNKNNNNNKKKISTLLISPMASFGILWHPICPSCPFFFVFTRNTHWQVHPFLRLVQKIKKRSGFQILQDGKKDIQTCCITYPQYVVIFSFQLLPLTFILAKMKIRRKNKIKKKRKIPDLRYLLLQPK